MLTGGTPVVEKSFAASLATVLFFTILASATLLNHRQQHAACFRDPRRTAAPPARTLIWIILVTNIGQVIKNCSSFGRNCDDEHAGELYVKVLWDDEGRFHGIDCAESERDAGAERNWPEAPHWG